MQTGREWVRSHRIRSIRGQTPLIFIMYLRPIEDFKIQSNDVATTIYG